MLLPTAVGVFGFGLLFVLLLSRVTREVVRGCGNSDYKGPALKPTFRSFGDSCLELTSTFPGSPHALGNVAAAQTPADLVSLVSGLKPQPGLKMAAKQ